MKPNLDLPDLLVCTPQGTWRIAGTRVSFDSVIHAFWEGATPEEICQDFPTLSLAQVYEAIAYYGELSRFDNSQNVKMSGSRVFPRRPPLCQNDFSMFSQLRKRGNDRYTLFRTALLVPSPEIRSSVSLPPAAS
jgi:uncharacterized protein (DUF433 family)